jgi:hypothetical protein
MPAVETVVGIFEPVERPTRDRSWRGAGAVLVVIAVVVAAVVVLPRGGRLGAAGYGLTFGSHPVGVQVNAGVELTAEQARSVVLRHVSVEHSPNVDVRVAVAYTAVGALGIGSSVGSTAPFHPVPVNGARIGNGSTGTAWLVVSVIPKRPGHWSVTHLVVSYASWFRHRASRSAAVLSSTAT